MIRSSLIHTVPHKSEPLLPAVAPKQVYVAAVRDLSRLFDDVEALFDNEGRVRTLTCSAPTGLFTEAYDNDPVKHARAFLESENMVRTLGLRYTELGAPDLVVLPTLGYRVDFPQVLTVGSEFHRVRNGYVNVFVDHDGRIYQVNSTVRHGRKPSVSAVRVSQEDAIAVARNEFGSDPCASERVELVYSAHRGRLDPVYEVTLTCENPRKVMLYLVKATNGLLVHSASKLRHIKLHGGLLPGSEQFLHGGRRRKPQAPQAPAAPVVYAAPVLGKVLLCVPEPNQPIAKQAHDAMIDSLPDRSVLKNHNLVVYLGRSKKEVKAKADGTFLYQPHEPEFSAVACFFAFNAQMELFKSWGMRTPDSPIPVHVDDPSVTDNAYFDPENYLISLGLGSGLPNGLTKYISHDLGVIWHENGHHVVFLQTPGKDLPGSEGGAIHESMGDVLGAMLMDFWFRVTYGQQLGHTLSAADIDADPRIIGKYCFPPSGIRIQKNKKRTPQDKTGEVHDDGLISGGAKADLLVAMCLRSGVDLKKSLEDFGRLSLAALALVPSHKVLFVDLLKAYLTADQKLFGGALKTLITKAFADHGIVLKKGGQVGRGTPVIIIV